MSEVQIRELRGEVTQVKVRVNRDGTTRFSFFIARGNEPMWFYTPHGVQVTFPPQSVAHVYYVVTEHGNEAWGISMGAPASANTPTSYRFVYEPLAEMDKRGREAESRALQR